MMLVTYRYRIQLIQGDPEDCRCGTHAYDSRYALSPFNVDGEDLLQLATTLEDLHCNNNLLLLVLGENDINTV